MKVSIVIPVYNTEQYIARCLNSALDQTYHDIEILLVDDCTPDKSVDVINKILATHPRKDVVKVLHHEHNSGLSCARNTGIDAATGDCLYFLDSDDYIAADTVKLLADAMMQHNVDMTIGRIEVVGNKRMPPLSLPIGKIISGDDIVKTLYEEQWHIMAYNKLVKTEFVKSHKLYFEPGIVHEDDLWTFKLSTTVRSIMAVDDAPYYYIIHPGSITGSMTMRHFDCRKKIITLIYSYLTANPELQTAATLSLFERYKSLYMRNIHNKMHDAQCDRVIYDTIRDNHVTTGLKLFPAEQFLSINYRLPRPLGYAFYRCVTQIVYKTLLLKIKLGME